jgi:hypothetical protein
VLPRAGTAVAHTRARAARVEGARLPARPRAVAPARAPHQYGLRTDGHGPLHTIGSYGSVGKLSMALSGVYKQPSGTTMRVASSRVDGHTFHEKRTPSEASTSCTSPIVGETRADTYTMEQAVRSPLRLKITGTAVTP